MNKDAERGMAMDRLYTSQALFSAARHFENKDRNTYAPVIALLKAESDNVLKLGLHELRNVDSSS